MMHVMLLVVDLGRALGDPRHFGFVVDRSC
jgi:hypothetical protein